VALVLSTRFRGLWFSLDRLLVHDGHYYRRRRGTALVLVRATDVHLSRPLRRALHDLLKPTPALQTAKE